MYVTSWIFGVKSRWFEQFAIISGKPDSYVTCHWIAFGRTHLSVYGRKGIVSLVSWFKNIWYLTFLKLGEVIYLFLSNCFSIHICGISWQFRKNKLYNICLRNEGGDSPTDTDAQTEIRPFIYLQFWGYFWFLIT